MAIRCSNCGSENPDDKKKCIKCNTILEKRDNSFPNSQRVMQESSSSVQGLIGTIPGLQYKDDGIDDSILNPTVPDAILNDKQSKLVNSAVKMQETVTCPHCKFLNLAPRKTCIKCQEALMTDKSPSDIPATKPLLKTIPPFLAKEAKYKCQFDFDYVSEGELIRKSITFTATDLGSVILNRANIAPENYTITSKSQAELSVENGEWSIIDTSELQTTFIKVQQDEFDTQESTNTGIKKVFRKVLHNSEIVLLGTTKLMFNCEEKVSISATIDPYRPQTHTCSFTELMPLNSTQSEPIHFLIAEGGSELLHYFSFSEKETAYLKRVEGKWFIQNETSFYTRPSEKTLLNTNDLILLGDLEIKFQKSRF